MKWTDGTGIVSLCSLCLPAGLLIWQRATGRWTNLTFVLFFSVGLLLSQMFHSFIFFRQDWRALKILPDSDLTASAALKLSLLLFSVCYVAMSGIRASVVKQPWLFAAIGVSGAVEKAPFSSDQAAASKRDPISGW